MRYLLKIKSFNSCKKIYTKEPIKVANNSFNFWSLELNIAPQTNAIKNLNTKLISAVKKYCGFNRSKIKEPMPEAKPP